MVEVIGFGLAGACVALQLQKAGFEVCVIDDGLPGSSQVAAGLVNPVAGRNFEPSWEVAEAWSIAKPFYKEVGDKLFHDIPVFRIWRDKRDGEKFHRKRAMLEQWIERVDEVGVTWKGGGWLDCPRFLKSARTLFLSRGGLFSDQSKTARHRIWCTGSAGLIRGEFTEITHRCAKGEILTVRIPGWNEKRILNRNGWVIPLGDDRYRVGATYEWDDLESGPTPAGRRKVEGLLKTFTDLSYEVLDHVAGIRPIINRSKPVVHFEEEKGWMVNGLGSKGVIYAPRVGLDMVGRLKI